jgi:hypothetical protein
MPSLRVMRHLRALLWALYACTLLSGGRPAVALEARPSEVVEDEYKVKAAFLYHFIRYTTWPDGCFEDEGSPIVVLVVGDDPFGSHLKVALDDKRVSGRKIVVRHSAEVPAAAGAHLIFEGRLGKPERDRLLALCKGRPVLLFGERPGFAAAGAQGNFYLEDAKVRFEINVDAVKASGLEISSQLLKLARRIHDAEGAGR